MCITCSADAQESLCMNIGTHQQGDCERMCAHMGGCSRDRTHLGTLAVEECQPEEGRRPAFADIIKPHLQRML